MKGKAFFEKLKKQGKIENEDFNKFIEELPDTVEVPDIFVNLFEQEFLTRDRASADFKIVNKIKAETLNGVDAELKAIASILDIGDQEAIDKEENTFKKVGLIKDAIPKLVQKNSKPSTDDKVKQLEKNNSELLDKIKSITTESETKIKDQAKIFKEKESSMKIDWTLDKQLAGFTFAEEFNGLKESIITNAVTAIKSKNHLTLDDKGQIIVNEVVDGVAKPKFNGNDLVTIDNLLLEPLKPFLKKNNSSETEAAKGKTENRREIASNVDPNKMTLQQMRKQGNTQLV